MIFKIFFMAERFAIKVFCNIRIDFISNSIIFFNKSSSSIKKYIHLVWQSKRFTYVLVFGRIICNGFYNHHTSNQLSSYSFLHQKKSNTLLMSTSSKKLDFYSTETYVFQFQYHKTSKFLYPYMIKKNCVSYVPLFLFKSDFSVTLQFHINSANNATVINTMNV